ncbi:ABC transporter substrate-binding protein [Afifella sp. H1R]|uniref:ABC transporter substrate-binding protein n=1 Tax=unclassified Afifella TaxID=2624128 RepID=UPI001F2F6450|nr:ABC transporter substrate-binding protein [Afifella sp. H1R]MCF1505253.1 ABC transporter substrate-binding protein [Afifella sp. H1R]
MKYTLGWARSFALSATLAAGFMGATAANAADTVRLTLPAKMFLNLVEFVAQDKGFYTDQDLDVEFTHIADSSVPIRTLIAGSTDIIEAGMSETLVAAAKGAKVKTVGGVHNGLHYAFWVRPGAGVESIKDLPGKNVAISSPGSLPHVVTLALLHKAGVTDEQIDTINWVSFKGSSARLNAVISGSVDATVASFSPEVERSGKAELLSIVGKDLPDYVMIPWDTSDDMIENRRDILKRFIKAELLAARFVFDNKDEALAVAKQHFDYSDEDLDAFYKFYTEGGIWDPNGLISDNAAEYMQQLNVDTGLQAEVLPADRVVDQSVTQEVLEDIGRYER